MIGFYSNSNNNQTKVINETLPTSFKPGCTLEDIKDELIKNNTKFEIHYFEEWYRNKTKTTPRHIDISCGYFPCENYNYFMTVENGKYYKKFANIPIKKIKLDQQCFMDGDEVMQVMDDFFNDVERNIVIIQLQKIMLDDKETPRDYSNLIDRDDMVNELTEMNYDEIYDENGEVRDDWY